ncbi:MAG TPA: 30S ribosomal protein S1 [Deltaproteobacteria bacterium]|nr:30S ribosomal protein S1 [Deltaproteobacteria bacterium]HPA83911.1 30S ribosomal protein S1 [Deltaproteobacteria bacterium]HRR20331.1 30S ribosomal protein S1 [Desulfomonilia bacterium]HRR67793.1 30S ribosomal protein S1 [Desulfomonilia bacterium]HRT43845.1 30S ribosomal protein S1 [Desulfomonilia bacterium]
MYSLEETKTDHKDENAIKEAMTESKETREESEEFDQNLELAALYEETIDKRVSTGSVVTGTVVQVGTDHIMIDIGRKMEGQAPIREFIDEHGVITISVGDEVEVLVESINPSKGIIRLSKEKARRIKIWDDIVKAYQENMYLQGTVTERIKGGLTVDIGVPAFLPTSQATLNPVSESELEKMVGKTIEVSIIKFNRKKNNVVVSHREVLERLREESKKKLIATLSKGDVVEGTVKNIMAYGAFVDIGGIDGLLHITDMSWGKLKDPKDKVSPGDVIKVKVIEFDPETEKISLGLKQLTPDPWEGLEYRYPIGKKISGKVTSITNYGAFVEIEEGVEGLVHISEMFWTKRMRHPSTILEEGQEVDVVVLGVDQENRRISLGLKQASPNPWDMLYDYYPPGTVVNATVKNVTDFGLFVSVDENIDIDGLIHVSDLTWDPKVKNPRELYKKGDVVQAKVLTVDPENEKFSLGLKQLSPDPWTQVANEHPVGSVIKGRVTSLTDFGAFVEIREGVEGMIHISEVSSNKIDNLSSVLTVGQEVEAMVLRLSPENKKIGLSIKALEEAQDKKVVATHEKGTEKVGTNLGELLKGLQDRNKGS